MPECDPCEDAMLELTSCYLEKIHLFEEQDRADFHNFWKNQIRPKIKELPFFWNARKFLTPSELSEIVGFGGPELLNILNVCLEVKETQEAVFKSYFAYFNFLVLNNSDFVEEDFYLNGLILCLNGLKVWRETLKTIFEFLITFNEPVTLNLRKTQYMRENRILEVFREYLPHSQNIFINLQDTNLSTKILEEIIKITLEISADKNLLINLGESFKDKPEYKESRFVFFENDIAACRNRRAPVKSAKTL
jgi:hypothetical protein